MSSTLILPDQEQPLSDPDEIREQLEHQVDLVIDGGFCGLEATTVVDLVNGSPAVLRRGKGDPTAFE
jgi:tRNA A37 threonylcarbamoyladenosine synthetase subunit TsaC/SUA5/YrdC